MSHHFIRPYGRCLRNFNRRLAKEAARNQVIGGGAQAPRTTKAQERHLDPQDISPPGSASPPTLFHQLELRHKAAPGHPHSFDAVYANFELG